MLTQQTSEIPQNKNRPPIIGRSASLGNKASIASTASVMRLTKDSSRAEMRFALQDVAMKLLEGERVCKCGRVVAAVDPSQPQLGSYPTVDLYSDGDGNAQIRNLQTCGSVWHCPVCSSRISEERRRELSLLIQQNKYDALLVTFTTQHHDGMKLADLYDAIRKAYRFMKNGRRWIAFRERYDWQGDVTSFEVTKGVNGWHPHFHMLGLLDQKTTPYLRSKIKEELIELWLNSLEKFGLSASYERGVDVQYTDEKVRNYVVKFGEEDWTIEHEITKNTSKVAKRGGDTPFQLLLKAGMGDGVAARDFKEYAAAMKGKNQLTWSKDFKKQLEAEVDEDVKAIEETDDTAWFYVGSVAKNDYYDIARTGYRFQLKQIAAYGEQVEIDRFVGIIKYQSGLTRIRLLEKLFNRCEIEYGRNTRVGENEAKNGNN